MEYDTHFIWRYFGGVLEKHPSDYVYVFHRYLCMYRHWNCISSLSFDSQTEQEVGIL